MTGAVVGLARLCAFSLLALAAGLGMTSKASTPAAPIVRVETGELRGVIDGPAVVFRAIPYAAPPIGPLRFRPPAAALSWNGVRDATLEGPACEQPQGDGRPNAGGYSGPVSEDCLRLTVTAPLQASGAAVLVWLPGGGNIAGAADLPAYNGLAFARDGVIVVSVNYRLGAFGFLVTPRPVGLGAVRASSGNLGLEDQLAALAWVERNIKAFGGDPAKVTLAGQSAGGEDVLTLMSVRAARSLFARAIVESGGGWGQPKEVEEREAQGAALLDRLGMPPDAGLAALQAIPAAKILAEQRGSWGPTIDGRLVRETIAQAFARGDEARAPLIIGSNSDEASLVATFGGDPSALAAAAPLDLREAYADEADDPDTFAAAIFSDRYMAAPARWIAAEHSRRAPTWLYYFDYVPRAERARRRGARHAGEIPFVFDSLSDGASQGDLAMRRFVHACWAFFIETGRAQCSASGRAWPPYGGESDESMDFGDEPSIVARRRKAELDAQEALAAKLLQP